MRFDRTPLRLEVLRSSEPRSTSDKLVLKKLASSRSAPGPSKNPKLVLSCFTSFQPSGRMGFPKILLDFNPYKFAFVKSISLDKTTLDNVSYLRSAVGPRRNPPARCHSSGSCACAPRSKVILPDLILDKSENERSIPVIFLSANETRFNRLPSRLAPGPIRNPLLVNQPFGSDFGFPP